MAQYGGNVCRLMAPSQPSSIPDPTSRNVGEPQVPFRRPRLPVASVRGISVRNTNEPRIRMEKTRGTFMAEHWLGLDPSPRFVKLGYIPFRSQSCDQHCPHRCSGLPNTLKRSRLTKLEHCNADFIRILFRAAERPLVERPGGIGRFRCQSALSGNRPRTPTPSQVELRGSINTLSPVKSCLTR